MPPTLAQLQRLTGAIIGIPPWIQMNLAGPGNIGFSPAFANVAQGQVACQYRVWALINEVEVIGTMSTPGSSLNNNNFLVPYRLPAPASAQQIPVVCEGQSAAPVTTPYFSIDQTGAVLLNNLPNTATRVSWHGWYSLDA